MTLNDAARNDALRRYRNLILARQAGDLTEQQSADLAVMRGALLLTAADADADVVLLAAVRRVEAEAERLAQAHQPDAAQQQHEKAAALREGNPRLFAMLAG